MPVVHALDDADMPECTDFPNPGDGGTYDDTKVTCPACLSNIEVMEAAHHAYRDEPEA